MRALARMMENQTSTPAAWMILPCPPFHQRTPSAWMMAPAYRRRSQSCSKRGSLQTSPAGSFLPSAEVTDDELETITPDYIWGAQTGEESERLQFASQLDQIVAEAKRRGKPEIIDRAKVSVVPLLHKRRAGTGRLV